MENKCFLKRVLRHFDMAVIMEITAGRENGSIKLQLETQHKCSILHETINFAKLSANAEKRMGYAYDMQKDTVVRISENGREEHRWRIGQIEANIDCCQRAFMHFYQKNASQDKVVS